MNISSMNMKFITSKCNEVLIEIVTGIAYVV